MKVTLFFVLLVACAFAQRDAGDIERIIIDDFSLGHNVNSVEIQPSTEIRDGVDASVSAEDPFNAGSG